MSQIAMRDTSRSGHPLGGAVVGDLAEQVTVRELLRARIETEVAVYNLDPGAVFVGLVQPEDAIRHSDGHRMAEPRPLDAERMVLAALQAVDTGMLSFRVGDARVADLDTPIRVDEHDEVVAVLERPIIARRL